MTEDINLDRSQYTKKILLLEFLDGIIVVFSVFLGLWVRFEFSIGSIPQQYKSALLYFLPIVVIATYIVYYFMRLYRSVWRFASLTEALRIVESYLILL